MIIIECKTLSVCFEDTVCGSSVEIFPPFTTETFANGFSVFGADGKSFYIPNNQTYEFDGVSKTYEEIIAEVPLCLSAITGNNEVQCFADFASFPLVGEDCVLYVDQDTNSIYYWDGSMYVLLGDDEVQCFADFASFPVTGEDCVLYIDEDEEKIYRWDGAMYVEISAGKEYEVIVAADGSGDYLLLSAAITAGETSIWIKNGTYTESAVINITADGTSIQGESIENTVLIMESGATIATPFDIGYQTGTLSITNDSTTVTLAGGTFTPDVPGEYIQIGKSFYEIASRTSATIIELTRPYQGDTRTGVTPWKVAPYTTGLTLGNFSITGWNGAAYNTESLLLLNNLLFVTLRNIYAIGTIESCFELVNCSQMAIENVVGLDAEAAAGGSGFGSGLRCINTVTLRVDTAEFSNCKFAAVSLSGQDVIFNNTNMTNSGQGIFISGPSVSDIKFDGCSVNSNNTFGVFGNINTDNIILADTHVRHNGSHGVYLQGEGCAVSNCNVSDNKQSGVYAFSKTTVTGGSQINRNVASGVFIAGDNVLVTDNFIEENSTGVYTSGADNPIITGNQIIANTIDGVRFASGSDGLLDNNQVLNNIGRGIRVDAATTGTIIGANKADGNGTDYQISNATTQLLIQHPTGISNAITVDPVAALEIQSTTQGVIFAKMTAVQASAIVPAEGLLLFVTSTDATFLSVGYWEYASGVWVKLGNSGLAAKSGIVAFGTFAGTPQKAAVVFSTAFSDNLYSVTITGEDSRSWQIESKTSTGFTINSNSAVALTGNTFFQAIKSGETL